MALRGDLEEAMRVCSSWSSGVRVELGRGGRDGWGVDALVGEREEVISFWALCREVGDGGGSM